MRRGLLRPVHRHVTVITDVQVNTGVNVLPAQPVPIFGLPMVWFTRFVARTLGATSQFLGKPGPEHLETARYGEMEAYFYVRSLGYRIVAKNFRTPHEHGKIDMGRVGRRSALLHRGEDANEGHTRASGDGGRHGEAAAHPFGCEALCAATSE